MCYNDYITEDIGFIIMKIDARSLSHQTLEELRIRTVKQVEAGASPEVLYKALGISRSAIYKWIANYALGGAEALKAKPIVGRPSNLDAKQIKWLAKTLIEKTPNQLKFTFALWTRNLIIEVIKNKFGIKVSRSCVTRILSRLGYSFQKPTLRFKKQDPVLVNKWILEDYKQIKAEAKKVKADIYFGDEANVSTVNYKLAKTIGKKGVTPIVKRTSARFKVNMLSAVSMRGETRFMVTEKSVNTDVFIEFLAKLIKGATNPIFLILDNHPIHKSAKVAEFVAKQQGRLKIFYLPPYSPELNPDEQVWNHVKNHSLSRELIDNLKDLKYKVYSSLFRLQKMQDKVCSFFKTPTTAYTLD
jgi:transposase